MVPCAVLAAGFLSSVAPASATEVQSPTIDGTTVTNVTEHGVTLVAHINPQGSETAYEFRLVWQDAHPPASGEPIPGGPQVHGGHIAAGFGDQTVSAILTGLQPGYTYWYVVVATNSESRAKAGPYWFGFHNGGVYPGGVGPGPPYETEIPEWSIDVAEEQAAQVVREYEARQRQGAKEHEELQATEAARLAFETAVLKRSQEEAASAKPAAPFRVCVVPSLNGDTLSVARRAIEKANCRLGRVSRPHRHRGALVVTGQAPRHGRKLAAGAAIALTLGSTPSRHRPRA
jgi:hypothetical protein